MQCGIEVVCLVALITELTVRRLGNLVAAALRHSCRGTEMLIVACGSVRTMLGR